MPDPARPADPVAAPGPLAAWASLMHRRRAAVLAASATVLAASLAALLAGGTLSTGAIEGIESDVARRQLETSLGLPGDASFTVVFSSPTLRADEKPFADALRAALAPVRADPRVERVLAPVDLPELVAAPLRSADGHHALAVVQLKDELRLAARHYPSLRAKVAPGPLQATFTGYLAFKDDLDRTLEEDLVRAELVSVPLAVLVLVWVFGTWVAALLPVLVGALAVLGGVAGVLLLSRVTDMAQYTVNVVSLIGLGVAIDYSLFIVSRFRDERAAGSPVEEALRRSLETSGRAVLFSGVAVGIGLGGLFFFPRSYLSAMGVGGALVVLLAVAAALTTLPALLSLLGDRLERGRVRLPRLVSEGRWHALATWVMARPVLVLVPVLAAVLALGAPFLRLEMAAADVTVLPAGAEARRGYGLLQRHFPAQVETRVEVVVEFPTAPAFTPARAGPLFDLSRRMARLPGVRAVESIVDVDAQMDRDDVIAMAGTPEEAIAPTLLPAWRRSVGGRVVALSALTDRPAASEEARALVRALRGERAVADGTLRVTGQTARDVDTTDFIVGHTPRAVGFVMALTALVLFLALRSVLLPLKAVLMNLLSISASFGALVFLFQEGHLAGLLRFEPRAIEPTLPVLLFCAVFGLSMDYEVLLLSRIQEEHRRGRDNAAAVAEGLERSARLITSAAVIMVSVFAAFGFTRVMVVKAMGVGMALAVALDATAVRMLIVPATMRLFGELNWWAPRPVARWFEGRGGSAR